MYLKRLEIVGFKSFADAFEMEFRRGISCVVGPNGCGKSNIADAIRWALGSQSPTELRADRMEDVIFSGTEERKPQGMAEVILTFDNTHRSLNLDFDEVTIARRLFRSGDSEYLINGNRCRLMDITDLVVDKGLGSNSYWILERNMTEIIIESGPSDRRFLFDEAAGIVKYKMQRHRAELKLGAVAADLERLDDIISEVERNVASLKKQVSAFRRWERAENHIREIRGLMEHRNLLESRERLVVLEERLRNSGNEEQKASAEVKAASARQSRARVSLDKAQARLDSEHSRCADLDGRMSTVARELAVSIERRRNNVSRMENLTEESTRQEERSRQLDMDASAAGEREQQLRDSIEAAGGELEKASEASKEAQRQHSRSASELEKARQSYRAKSLEAEELQKEYADSLRSRERTRQELEHALQTRGQMESSLEDIQLRLGEAEDSLGGLAPAKVELADKLEAVSKDRSDTDSRILEVREQLHSLEMEQGLLRVRIEGIREASSPLGDNAISALLIPGEGMGKAIGAWLDSFQDALVLQGGEELPEGGGGERFYLSRGHGSRPPVPPGGVWLPECAGPETAGGLKDLLSGAVLAPDRETAAKWFIQGLDLDIVTREGDLFRKDGLVRLGVPESGTGSLEREELEREALGRMREITDRMETLQAEDGELQEKLAAHSGAIEELRNKQSQLEKEEASLQAGIDSLVERRAGLTGQLDSLALRIPELEKGAREQDRSGTARQMQECREEMDRLSGILSELEKEKDARSENLNLLLRRENEARLELSSLETSLQQTSAERKRLSEESRRAIERCGDLREQVSEIGESQKELEDAIRDLENQQRELSGLREEAENSRNKASEERARWLKDSRNADDHLSQCRERLSSLREERATLSGEVEALGKQCRELESMELVLPDEKSRFWDYDLDKLQSELEKQTGFRENLGPINMLAVTEYDEGCSRIEFLSEQRKDLDEARTSLLDAISEINRTAARKFDETFVEVRSHFKEMFSSLFGGGEADILALDSEDPLEGGVQIVARPPGKKLENITALSSGERAMTAAALLFALYLVKPSPFCVLDELDAPLDDTNVDNYVNLLKGFVQRTQFIVITHNKRTMEAADRLFGITMAEKGVSTMTTVNLEKAMQISENVAD